MSGTKVLPWKCRESNERAKLELKEQVEQVGAFRALGVFYMFPLIHLRNDNNSQDLLSKENFMYIFNQTQLIHHIRKHA